RLRRQLFARKPNDYDDNFLHRVFHPAVRRTGLTGLRFHDLRHTYAALMAPRVRVGSGARYVVCSDTNFLPDFLPTESNSPYSGLLVSCYLVGEHPAASGNRVATQTQTVEIDKD